MFDPSLSQAPIVIVEDNDADYETLLLLLREAGVTAPVERFATGSAAMAAIKNRAWTAQQLPVHFIVDLNLPGEDGVAILRSLRAHDALSPLPVTILTTSNNPKDVESCYRAGANSYLTKPVNFQRFSEIVQNFAQYWFATALLPLRTRYGAFQ